MVLDIRDNSVEQSSLLLSSILIPKAVESTDNSVLYPENGMIDTGGKLKINRYKIGNFSFTQKKNAYDPIVTGSRIYVADPQGIVQARSIDNPDHVLWSVAVVDSSRIKDVQATKITKIGNSIIVAPMYNVITNINSKTGKILWQTKINDIAESRPVVIGDNVIVSTKNSNVYALAIKDGGIKWVVESESSKGTLKASNPLVVGNNIIVAYRSGYIEAIEINSGNVKWKKNLNYVAREYEYFYDFDATPIMSDHNVVASDMNNHTVSINIANGNVDWIIGKGTQTDLHKAGNVIYMIDGSNVLIALEEKSGTMIWSKQMRKKLNYTETDASLLYYTISMIDDKLLLTNSNRELQIVDPKGGELLHTIDIGCSLVHKPIVKNNKLYMTCSKNGVSEFLVLQWQDAI